MRALCMLFGIIAAGVLSSCLAVDDGCLTTTGVQLSRDVADLLATELASRVRATFPPARTTLLMTSASDAVLRSALEHQLRKAGFAVATDARATGGLPTDCAVSRIADRQFRVTLRVGEGFEASRAYEVDERGRIEALTQMTVRHDPEMPQTSTLPDPGQEPLLAQTGEKRKPALRLPVNKPESKRPVAGGALAQPPPVIAQSPAPPSPLTEPGPTETKSGATLVESRAVSGGGVSSTGEEAIVLSPNRDHVIEISAALFSTGEGGVPNPFIQQYQPKTPGHELAVSIAGIVMGPHPTAVVNERVCSIGEAIDGFRVQSIEANLVVLRWENFELRIPADSQSVTVRYP